MKKVMAVLAMLLFVALVCGSPVLGDAGQGIADQPSWWAATADHSVATMTSDDQDEAKDEEEPAEEEPADEEEPTDEERVDDEETPPEDETQSEDEEKKDQT